MEIMIFGVTLVIKLIFETDQFCKPHWGLGEILEGVDCSELGYQLCIRQEFLKLRILHLVKTTFLNININCKLPD